MFWGMLEMGVGIVAICLPTLRPLFMGWSPETLMRSVRSVLSLRSMGSSKRSRYSENESKKFRERGESQTSLAGDALPTYAGQLGDHQVYALGPMAPLEEPENVQRGAVMVNKELTQTVNIV